MNELFQELIQCDKQTFLYLNNLGNENWDAFWLVVTEKKSWIPLYLFLLFLLYRQLGIKKTFFVIILTALLITISDQTCNLFKHSIARFRPCYNDEILSLMRLVKDGCGGKFGFVSAHAANHFALALFLGNILGRKYKISLFLFIPWAMLVAYSRIYVGVHYPLDSIFGALLGSVYGYSFYLLYKKFENNKYTKS
jgi:undecaprenyl-diphosphatase